MFCSRFDLITRAIFAAGLPLILALFFGPRLIAWLDARFREPLKADSPTLARLHADKSATPTMGGLFIVAGICLSLVLFSDWSQPILGSALCLMLGYAAIGAIDDLTKQRSTTRGLRARSKLLAQFVVATMVAGLFVHARPLPLAIEAWLPLQGSWLPWLLTAWAAVVIVGSSNAVNLADGLDGLASGLVAIAAAGLMVAALLSGKSADQIQNVCVLGGGLLGSALAFLYFNRHPARVFMGDTGSLPLGALLGLLALAIGQELLWMIIGGVFVAEALSVILQVGWFKCRQERVFRCAPLHHHFQFLGWTEQKIVVRFWLVALLCAATGLAVLRLPSWNTPRPCTERWAQTAATGEQP